MYDKNKMMEAFGKAKPLKSEDEKKAKMGILHELKKAMGEDQDEKLKGLKKVSVMSNSKEGLEEGLHKAQDIIHGKTPEMQETEDASDGEMDEAAEEEMEEKMHPGMHKDMLAECSPEEIAEMIKMIKAKGK